MSNNPQAAQADIPTVTPRMTRFLAGGTRFSVEHQKLIVAVRLSTDRKVPEGMSRGPLVQFDLAPNDALTFAAHLHSHAEKVLAGGVA